MFDKTKIKMDFDRIINDCKAELAKIHTGRPKAESFEDISVFAYEMNQPVRNLALVNVPDISTVKITPFDKNNLKPIEKGISDANLGFTPRVEGDSIWINIPPMTQERREQAADQMDDILENRFKRSVRQLRQDIMHSIDALKGTDSEDTLKLYREQVEQIVKSTNVTLDEMASARRDEIMNISGK